MTDANRPNGKTVEDTQNEGKITHDP